MPLARRLRPSRPHAAPRPASYALLSTRQGASAFNKPLSFDTSSVIGIAHMFQVPSARALSPRPSQSGALRARRLRRLRPRPSCLSAHTSPRIVRPAFDSAGNGGLQPATEFRHIQGHKHAPDVLRALRACPGPQPSVRPSPCMPLALPPPHALQPPNPHLCPASYALLSTWQTASAFNQPLSFDTSSVIDTHYMFYVRSARAQAPSLQSGPPRACHLRCHRPTPFNLPARTSSRIACPPLDSAAREGVQPAAELRHVQGHRHALDVHRALRACPGPQPSAGGLPVHATCAATAPRSVASRPAPRPTSHALLSTRQGANSLSAANKLLIRCAWAGTPAFASAGYGSWWGPGSCTSS
eukprot:scaffold33741_cov63-Phaeocystis_antarctica.AAC.9